MRKQRMFGALMLISGFLGATAHGDVVTDRTPWNARSRAMGGVGLNILDDAHAAFYNPANLANKRVKPRLELVNLQLELGVGAVNQVATLNGIPTSIGDSFSYMKANPGHWVSHRYSVFPNFTSRFFTFGLLYESAFGGKYDNAPLIPGQTDTFTQRGLRRVAPTATLSFRLWGGILKFGYTLMVEHIGKVNSVVSDPSNKTLAWNNGIQEGFGVRHIVGTTLTLPFSHLPSFSVIVRDVGQTSYFGGTLSEVNKMSIDAGVSHTTHFGKALKMRLSADARDYTNQTKTNFMRRFFSGAEFDFFNVVKVRGGWGQGYPSAGFSFWLKKAKVDFTWYSEEVGNRYRDHQDQRFLLQWTWATIQ